MRSRHLLLVLAVLVTATPLLAADSDGDGISDAHEEALGTDPQFPERLIPVHEDGIEPEDARGEGYDPSKDIVSVAFCHVAEDRYLWRTTFAAAPNLEDTVHHYYIDADANEDTGREGYGVEYMLSIVGGGSTSGLYTPDGLRTPGPLVSFVVDGDSLLVSADCQLGRDDEGVNYRMYVLCHTTTGGEGRPAMSDSTSHFLVEGIPVNDRDKIMRPRDYTESFNVAGTFGLDIIREVLREPENVVVRYDELQVDGFEVDLQTSRRYGHLVMRKQGARAWTEVERAGTYYPGLLVYDDGADERFVIRVNDNVAGVVVANANNNRHWIYHLDEPIQLQAGDEVSFEAVGGGGKHGISRVLLMPEAPERREIEYLVENTRWVSPVGTEGDVWLSWTTTWPSPTRFEYGTTVDYGETIEVEDSCLVHRAHLSGLEPGVTYHGRGVGIAPDGSEYAGPDIAFTADGIDPPPTREGVTRVPMIVRNETDFDAVGWPVTNGIPFPEGALGSVDDIRVMRGGEEVAAQLKPLGTWRDGSIKWVLVSLLADVPAGGVADYTLEFGRGVDNMMATARYTPIAVERGGEVRIDTGAVQLTVDEHGQLVGPDGPCVTEMTVAGGRVFSTALRDAETTIEEAGPIRAVVKTAGRLAAEDGTEGFEVEQRIVAWRDRPLVRIHHTFVNTLPEEFTDVERMSFRVPGAARDWAAMLEDGGQVELPAGRSVWQRFDAEFVPGDGEPVEGRIDGGMVARDGSMAIAMRDMWENYPAGFAVGDDAVEILLCPDFEAGIYDQFPFEEEGHHLYYYLRDGTYTFKRGMAKTHELMIDFGSARAASNCALFQRPMLLTAEPEWYCDSKAFYSVAPRDEERFAAYEAAIDENLANYIAARERQHDFGLMNYGDWYGERGSNWGNIEYDTQHAFFLEYIRSGNPDAFFLGDVTELHNREIDTVHWASDPDSLGMVYVHQMGHVGGYYDKSVPGTLGFPSAGASVSHAWTEGHFDHYFLTGDQRSYETGRMVADYFIRKHLSSPYDFTSCRVPGWHLIMNAAALAATNDPYYLNASRIIIDRVLETQDKQPRELPDYQKEPGRTHQQGGWTRMMVPGHCHCEPRHRGNAGFMVAVLLSGMTYYHDVTAEPEVKQAIIAGAHYLLDECYSEETHGFRYTSCPATRYGTGASPLMVEGVARAYRWTGDEHFLDPLTNGLAHGVSGAGYGKSFSMYYRCAPRLLADLAAMGLTLEEAPKEALVPFEKPEWMSALDDDQLVVIQAEDFVEQGGGVVEERDDRHATWGTMITKWHQDIGHWLRWHFEVPESARYRILFRYATGSENTRRELRIDGEVPAPEAREIAFPKTGGYGTSPADWQYLTLTDRDGTELALPLAAGEHTLTMTNLGDGLGLDFIAIIRDD